MQVMVGRIGRAHGIHGDVVVGVSTDEPQERFAPGSVFDTDRGPLTVESARWHSGQLLIRFSGCADRNAAEDLRGLWLGVDSETLPPPDDPDEFRDHDLVGLAVETIGGRPVGVVTDVLHRGQDLLCVQNDGGELLIPFVKAIVPDVDLKARLIRIDPPPGLLDLLCASTSSRSSPTTSTVRSPSRSSARPRRVATSASACTTCAAGRPTFTTRWTTRRSAADRGW